jgi:aryl-alcohol dehydrogenase-like predicted oxidoreductase
MMAAAFDAGVNFFDNAEAYAAGQSEVLMGQALKTLGWPRLNYIVSTKFFWGLDRSPAVNRKQHAEPQVPDAGHRRLAQALRAGAHRSDLLPPPRPAHADRGDGARDERHHHAGQGAVLGHQRVERGDIRAAWEIAERHHLHKPVVEQPQYHLFHRERVEKEYARLYDDIGLGLTTWSPLASGLLTGKYQGRRAGRQPRCDGEHGLPARRLDWTRPENAAVAQLAPIAAELGGTWPSWPLPG